MNASITELNLTERKYTIKPLFTQLQNHIRVKLSKNAEGKVQILNTVPDSNLSEELKKS